MILELLVLASLLRVDPAGDAYGAGDLIPPSAALYADLSPFDLIEVEAGGTETLTVRIRLAGIPDPGGLPNGLTLPVIDVYLDLADGGETLALPGVGMAMPDGHGWEVALRVHGDGAFARRSDDPTGPARPVSVEREGDEITLRTSLPVPESIRDVQAVTGVYDPFSSDGWRPIAPLPSPWAFSSQAPAPPVVDLLADRDERQRDAIRAYVLPTSRPDPGPVGWIVLMLSGLGVAAAGLWLRRRVPGERGGVESGPQEAAGSGELGAEPSVAAETEQEADADACTEAEAGSDGDDPQASRSVSDPDVPVYRIGRAARGATHGAPTGASVGARRSHDPDGSGASQEPDGPDASERTDVAVDARPDVTARVEPLTLDDLDDGDGRGGDRDDAAAFAAAFGGESLPDAPSEGPSSEDEPSDRRADDAPSDDPESTERADDDERPRST